VDPVDGLLCQVTGRKCLTVSPVPTVFSNTALVQFSLQARPELFPSAQSIEVELTPGKALLLPAGAAHAVYVPEGEKSVSISFASFSAYPVVDLCSDLNNLCETPGAFELVPSARFTDLHRCLYLNPSICRRHRAAAEMPPELKCGVLEVITSSDSNHSRRLPALLDAWWQYARQTRSYLNTPPRGQRPPRAVVES
jgi:hypothetical protein